jgi:hypothetical protein
VSVCTKSTTVLGMYSVRALVFSHYVFGNTSGHSGKLYLDHLLQNKSVCTAVTPCHRDAFHARYLYGIITLCMVYVHTHTHTQYTGRADGTIPWQGRRTILVR